MLKIWGRRSSINVQKVLWLADELGLRFEHIAVGGDFGGLDSPQFLKLNPHGRVPVLEDDAVAVWESHSILRYLAARFAPNAFWSDEPGVRASREGWMDWTQTALQPAFIGGVFWGLYRTPEHMRDTSAVQASLARTNALFRLLDQILAEQPFLGGDALSLADIPAGALLYRYFELDIQRPSLPHVEAWYGRLAGRAAYREHIMVAFDDLRGRLAY